MPDGEPPEPESNQPAEESLAISEALSEADPAPAKSEAPLRDPSIPWWRARLNRWGTIRDQPSQLERIFFGLACIFFVVLIWHLLTMGEGDSRIVNAYTLPSPWETLASFPSLWYDRELSRSVVWSLGRVLGGFLLAAAFAIPLGVAAASFRRVNAFFRPLSVFGRNIPIAALIPLSLMWFGLGETQKVMFIFLASAAFIFFDTTHAVDGVSSRFLDTAYTLGARPVPKTGLRRSAIIGAIYALVLAGAVVFFRILEIPSMTIVAALKQSGTLMAAGIGLVGGFLVWFPIQSHQAVHKVLLPLALPNIVNSLRLLFGLAFGYIMLAEVINAKLGLGNIITMSQRRGPREHIYLILIIIALLAFGIDRLVFYLQKRWFPYRENAGS